MKISDFIIPLLGFLLVLNSIFFSIKNGIKTKNWIELIIGILIMGFSWWIASENSDDMNGIKSSYKKLEKSSLELLEQRRMDSIDNSTFQSYLKKTFGIIRQGDTAVKKSNSSYEGIRVVSKTTISDDLNFHINLTNNLLKLSPREGVWINAFVALDTANKVHANSMMNEGMGTANKFDVIKIGGKIYNTNIVYSFGRSVYMEKPIQIDISKNPNQYVIFGEEGSSKRYIYKNGKVTWVPF